jgi:hypothetical protein
MKPELEKKLYDEFPGLYEQRDWSIQASCMPWGFECGDGWFDLIYKLSKRLAETTDKVRAVQVKEKFGGLRFYYTYSEPVDDAIDDKVRVFINVAEDASFEICEWCGSRENVTQTQGWIVTLCDKCLTKRQEERGEL